MKHQHHPMATEQAHGLLSCRGLELSFCACGAIRLNGCEHWVCQLCPPPEEFTAAEVPIGLHSHRTTGYQLGTRGRTLRQSQMRS